MTTSTRQKLPARRANITQKARVGGQTLHLTIGRYEDGRLAEVFVDLHKSGSAMRAWAGATALLISVMLQYEVPPKEIVDALLGINSEPFGSVPVTGDERIKECAGVLDYIARVIHLESQPPAAEPPKVEEKVMDITEKGSGV